ncbi:hypothetical protein KAW65_06235 [candidate division WOR-3 bacterium]|nr:hypothetical protein [candidate division WOR-3 bacterium]
MRNFLTSLAALLIIVGCKGTQGPAGPPGTVTQKPYVIGGLYKGIGYPYPPVEYSYAYVEVYHTSSIPVVTINGDTLPLEHYYYGGDMWRCSYGWYTYWRDDTISLFGDSTYVLEVIHSEGVAQAEVKMPGEFEVIEPDTSDTLHRGEDLNIIWTTSKGAEWYKIYLSIHYSYIDTSGEYEYFCKYFEPLLQATDTTYFVSGSELFPADIDSVRYGDGYLYIYAGSGDAIEPGATGNITGDGAGFFWGKYKTEKVYFEIENSGKKAISHKEVTPYEDFKKTVEFLKTNDERLIKILEN